MSQKTNKWVRVAVCVLLAGFTFGLYSVVGRYEFTALDDTDYVTENADVMAGVSWNGVRWAFTHTFSSNWHPLTCLSHMLDCQFFGLNAGAHHLENVGFHVANTLLLLLLLTRITTCFWRSTFVAALFALHPVHVESVAWISERKDVLSTFFFLLTLLSYATYVSRLEGRRPGTEHTPQSTLHAPRYYALTLFLFALGLLSKPMVVTVPFVLLLLDYWPLQRFGFPDMKSGSLRMLLLEKVPFLILSAISCGLTVWAQGKGNSLATLEMIPLSHRLIHSVVAYSSYLGKIFWPTNLAVCYASPSEVEYGLAAVSVLFLLAISVVALAWRNSRPYVLIGWLWYLGTLVPVIGIVQVGAQGMADRYTYIPSIGIFLALTWLVAEGAQISNLLYRRASSLRQPRIIKGAGGPPGLPIGNRRYGRLEICATTSLVAVVACSVLSYSQIRTWRTTRTVFEHALKVSERNFMAYTSLGNMLAQEGNPEKAIEYFRTSLKWMPSYPLSWFGLGNALCSIGKQSEGEECFQKMLALSPNDPELIDGYALMLMKQKKADEAERLLQRALELRPNFPEGHLHLAVLLQQHGRWDEAAEHYQSAIRFKPASAELHGWYADGLARQKQPDAALEQYRVALRIQPSLTQAQLGLASALVEKRQFKEAAAHFSAILTICPTNAGALDGLGYTLALRNKPDEAYPYFVKATSLCPTNSFAQLHLAMELARRGDKAQAVAHYRLAITNGPDLVLGMNNLAWMLATDPSSEIRNGAEAVGLAERVCQLSNERVPFFIGTLAAAYAEAGRFEDATKAAEKAHNLAQSLGMREVAERNLRMLELYRAGKAYREGQVEALKR